MLKSISQIKIIFALFIVKSENMSDKNQDIDVKKDADASFEKDDEFDEFPAEEWDNRDKEPEIFWEEKWDDDNVEDDFSKQLKAVLEQNK